MSISSQTLNAIQRAGQAIDAARTELVADTQSHADKVAQAVSGNPFGVENDGLFNAWKALARIAQEVQMIEVQFRAVYESAAGLAIHEATPLSPPRLATTARRVDSAAQEATDVEPKPQLRRGPALRQRRGRSSVEVDGQRLSGNNAIVYRHLRDLLNRKSWTRLTQSSICAGAGIPLGSVAAAMRQLAARGVLVEGQRGHYKLL